MKDFQNRLPWDFASIQGVNTRSLILDLWRRWNDGNYSWVTRDINRIVDTIEERIRIMSPKPDSKFDASKFYFVSCSVSETDIPEIERLYPTPDTVFDFLVGVLAEGLKVSFAVNAKNDLTICSLTDKTEGSASYGGCLTGGADGWYDALRVVAYKYTALLHGDMSQGERGESKTMRIL